MCLACDLSASNDVYVVVDLTNGVVELVPVPDCSEHG